MNLLKKYIIKILNFYDLVGRRTNMNVDKLTFQERRIFNSMPNSMKESMLDFTTDNFAYLDMVRMYLSKIYGEKADWKQLLAKQEYSSDYAALHKSINCIDDVTTLDTNQLTMLIDEDKDYSAVVKTVLELMPQVEVDNTLCIYKLLQVGQLLGLVPFFEEVSIKPLNSFMIDSAGITEDDVKSIVSDRETAYYLYFAEKILVHYYLDGLQVTYPIIGTVMKQPKAAYYYRGENAYYGSSRPGLYRKIVSHMPKEFRRILGLLKYDECGAFFDKFSSIIHWGWSSVNHVALMQHYGLTTSLIDVTSSIMVALFFACCYWKNNEWRPLTNKQIAKSDSRKNVFSLGGDSRYGVLYRYKVELDDIHWALDKPKDINGEIVPVGYQPFMRCKSQYAYTIYDNDTDYDLYKDKRFEKYKFLLNEDFCEQIYEEMGKGKDIYPDTDVPDITRYLRKIDTSPVIPKEIFDEWAKLYNYNKSERAQIRSAFERYGYRITGMKFPVITKKEIDSINSAYTVQKIQQIIGFKPLVWPIMVIG